MRTPSPGRGGAAELRGRRSELAVLDRLIEAVRGGKSRVLVIRGEPGIGKTALLEYVAGKVSGCGVARAAGIQSEMELPFAGLHQLLTPMLDRLDDIPAPQGDALRTAFGLGPGATPDRLLVALAVLSLLAEEAKERPLLCVVDDEHWLDRASAQILAFVARRLAAEPIGIVFAARGTSDELEALPELAVEGLRETDARALLDSALTAPLDARVREQIVAETRGNPLALLELARKSTPAQLAGGYAIPGDVPLSNRIEEAFQLDALPAETRRFLVLVAADPTGEPLLLWQAAARLGIDPAAADPATEAGLVEFGARVRLRHPLVRSAAYRSASFQERQSVHGALAEATDPEADPDRRAWHRAQATAVPDERVAEELGRSADRALARGGLAAAAAFLERAAILTPEAGSRAQRLLAAARVKRDAGELDAALGLLAAIVAGPADTLLTAEVDRLRGQIALEQRRGSDAAQLLLSAARRLEPLDSLARETYLEALGAAIWAGDLAAAGDVREAAEASRATPSAVEPPRAVDVLLDALAIRLTEGYAAAVSALTQALEKVLAVGADDDDPCWLWLGGGRASILVALELWDAESWYFLAARQAEFARQTGALVHLQFALNFLVPTYLLGGELTTAALMVEEDRRIAEATGNPPVSYTEMNLAAWQGREREAAELIESALREARANGLGRLLDSAAYTSSVLYNGLSRHQAARDAAWEAFQRDSVGIGPFVVPELAEAASRTGNVEMVEAALKWLSERTSVTPTDWALGVEARVRALMSQGETADLCYRESIAHLSRTPLRVQVARGHLLYGEWLRRDRRRADAREQLRIAYEMLAAMNVEAFAARARRELLAVGGTIRKRTPEAQDELTAQEAQIARLARDGLSNPEIGARLFVSPLTVKYHLRKVFAKLKISSRRELNHVLPGDPNDAGPQ
ncbi:AAA family ATPase [Saccharopolyspora sp. K220]|nr:AAA family ATPase [Saccharopolyspora soli]